ncbi:MAG TPA: hypothetical protein VGS59_06585 [Candidatus Acidoferrales bacterium]|nr:hypothetical protein [Candidatus Acidoferrales bacterium]
MPRTNCPYGQPVNHLIAVACWLTLRGTLPITFCIEPFVRDTIAARVGRIQFSDALLSPSESGGWADGVLPMENNRDG